MVLLVIDVQTGITDERLYRFKQFEENLKNLIDTSRKCGVEVIYVRHDDGPGSGFSKGDADFEIYEGVAPKSGEKIFEKNECDISNNEYIQTINIMKSFMKVFILYINIHNFYENLNAID